MVDRSHGWDAIADRFIAVRSDAGADVVAAWARQLPDRAEIVDVGCGSGVPVSQTLIAAGFRLHGIDASPQMVSAFRRRFPDHPVACEAAEDSAFFDRTFDAAVAIGLLFLLPAEVQAAVLARMAAALRPGGHILFSAPAEPCQWVDSLTGQPSRSLGIDQYQRILRASGQTLKATWQDEGGNCYFGFAAAA